MTVKQQLKLGDVVAKLAKALRIPHCEKCEQRRLILNEIKVLGLREAIKRLRIVGLSNTKKSSGEPWSVEEIVKKMENCCDEK